MRMRLVAVCALGCLSVALGWTSGCSSGNSSSGIPTGPTTPTTPPPTLTALAMSGNLALTAVGQTSQLIAEATYSDGSKRDVSSSAQWSSSNRNVATVSGGLVTAVGLGRTNISASTGGRNTGARALTVLPEGTYILSGRVSEVGNLSIPNARIDLVGGPMSGQFAMTDGIGRFTFNGVSGVTQVRATKDGYQPATQNVSPDTENTNVQMTAAAPYASLGGTYRLVFTASPSCQLPADAMSRTYTAAINQVGPGATLTVLLSDAQFYRSGQILWNLFTGRVLGNQVTFTLWNQYYGFYYGGGVVEQITSTRFLSISGNAQVRVPGPAGFSAEFPGVFELSSSGNGGGRIAICSAADHRMDFTRLP